MRPRRSSDEAAGVLSQVKDQPLHALPLELLQGAREFLARMLGEGADADVAHTVREHFPRDGLHLDGAARQRVVLVLLARTTDRERDIRADLAADVHGDLLRLILRDRRAVDGNDLIARTESGALSRRSLHDGDDAHAAVLEPHVDADAAEAALRLAHELAVHLRIEIDGVRVAERLHHTADRAVHEFLIVDIADVTALDEAARTEKAREVADIFRAEADEIANAADRSDAAREKCRETACHDFLLAHSLILLVPGAGCRPLLAISHR